MDDWDKLDKQFTGAAPPAASSNQDPWDQLDATYSRPAPAPAQRPKVAAVKDLPQIDQRRSWSDVPLEALGNVPASASNFVGNIVQAVRHPLDTAGNLADVLDGAWRKVLPDGGARADADRNRNPNVPGRQSLPQQQAQRDANTAKADAVGGVFKDRYGSADGLKNTLATDPVGALSDASAVLSGGAGLAGRLPAVAGGLRTASRYTNPLALPGAVARTTLPFVGNVAANVIGGMATHTGAESIRQAYSAGRRGGSTSQTLADNMRGNVPMTDVLDAAKANLADMTRQKSTEYRQGMAQVSGDRSVLDFSGIDQAVKNAESAVSFKGQAKNQRAADVQQRIAQEVGDWKALDPVQYHTPEGLDALKQRIGGIIEALPYEEKTARMAGNHIYHAVKAEIVKQAPVYADTMKGYVDASDQIREIERTLSLGRKPTIDTAMRKLQSLTRNNANTNYGLRLDLARQLEQQGGRELLPALSGQALSSWTPRGLGSVVAGGTGVAAALGSPQLLPFLAMQSPRLMGEAALAAGKGARQVRKLSDLPRKVATPNRLNLAGQAGKLNQEMD